ncbi:hypothetical protein D3C85_1830920 [compost metagenome]
MVALTRATSNDVPIAIKPTSSVTPTALRNAGRVLRIKAKSKFIEHPGRRSVSDGGAVHGPWITTPQAPTLKV